MKILLVEDERLLADAIATLLQSQGFEVEPVYDGCAGLAQAELGIYDLLIIDVIMPGLDGYSLIRKVRSIHHGTPILMLAAKSEVEDRIKGLNAGADYYLTKPFDTKELLASINALLRRHGNQVNELAFGNTALDLSTCLLKCGQKQVRLSAREFDVMRLLLQAKDQVIRKEGILAHVWGIRFKRFIGLRNKRPAAFPLQRSLNRAEPSSTAAHILFRGRCYETKQVWLVGAVPGPGTGSFGGEYRMCRQEQCQLSYHAMDWKQFAAYFDVHSGRR